MTAATPTIRPAIRTDADAVGDVLAEAFDDYPWIRCASARPADGSG